VNDHVPARGIIDLCELGCGRPAIHTHHRKLRSQGGDESAENLLRVCLECHTRIHAEPAEAYANGWLVKSFQNPAEVPVVPTQMTVDGREEPWQQHTHDGDVEECGRCKGTGRVKRKPPKEETQAPERKKVVYAIRVPKDEQENGYEVLETLLDDAAEKLKVANLLKSVNRGANYYALVYVLSFFAQNFKPEAE